ncbi:MAG: hypothetical protein U1E49_07670 [Hyphomicrobiaceae bacterium]
MMLDDAGAGEDALARQPSEDADRLAGIADVGGREDVADDGVAFVGGCGGGVALDRPEAVGTLKDLGRRHVGGVSAKAPSRYSGRYRKSCSSKT